MEMKDTLSSYSNSKEQQMQQIQDKAKESCMVSFRRLHSHLKLLSNNDLKGTRTESGFKRAFAILFGQDLETFTGTMFLNMDQLEKQLDNEEFQEIGSMVAFKIPEFHDTLIQHMESVKKSIDKRALHKREYEQTGRIKSNHGNDAMHDDEDIHKPINVEEPMAGRQLVLGGFLRKDIPYSTTKVDSEPTNGSKEDTTNQYECEQTLDVSVCTLNLSAGISFNPKKEGLRVWLLKRLISHKPGLQGILI
ncbi:hypothetical protein Tco_0915997 [Tanacetum coccineum]